jgi:hypothetical protein
MRSLVNGIRVRATKRWRQAVVSAVFVGLTGGPIVNQSAVQVKDYKGDVFGVFPAMFMPFVLPKGYAAAIGLGTLIAVGVIAPKRIAGIE